MEGIFGTPKKLGARDCGVISWGGRIFVDNPVDKGVLLWIKSYFMHRTVMFVI